MPPLPDTAALLAEHAGWMRRLAQRLVRDADQAEDLVQDAAVATLRQPPRDASRLRAFLRRVLTHRHRELHRVRRSALRRELAHAQRQGRLEPAPATSDVVARVHTQRRLAGLLLALDEPYRTVLLLRFYEDLPPRRIAQRTGATVVAVKSQLQRGLVRLRALLDADAGGDRAAWLAALLPLCRLRAVASGGALLTSTWIMNSKLTVVSCVLVSLAVGYFLWPSSPRPETSDWPDAGRALASVATDGGAGGADGVAGTRHVEALRGERRALATAPPVVALTYEVRGRAVDADARPVPALRVGLRGLAGAETFTAPDGTFTFTTSAESGTVDVADPKYVAVRTGAWSRRGELMPVLVVAPVLDLAGHVVDTWGRRVAEAQVVLALPAGFGARFRDVLDASYEREWRVSTNADGSFALAQVPAIAGSELRVAHPEYAPLARPAPDHADPALWLEMVVPQVEEGQALRGVVFHADGSPAPGALVALGLGTTRTDAGGAFTLDLQRCGPAARVTAVAAGEQPAVLDRPEPPAAGPGGWPTTVELRLGPPALSISGRVVDEHGHGRGAGARVWVADASTFGVLATLPLQLEPLMAGGHVPTAAIEALATPVDPEGDEDFGSASPALAPDALVHWVETDADGRFELGGLLPRAYRVCVLGKDFAYGQVGGPITAPAHAVELVVKAAESLPRLRGRVVSTGGDPIGGVHVGTWVSALSLDVPVRGGRAHVMRFFLGPSTTTDADGWFVLPSLPRHHTKLHLSADVIVPSYADVDDARDPEAFVVPVRARAHLEVEVAPGRQPAPDAIRVRAADGSVVTLLEMRADGYSTLDAAPLRDGRSGVLTVTTDAVTLELLSGGEVVEASAIEVHAGVPLRLRR